jgi:hypothetical protein
MLYLRVVFLRNIIAKIYKKIRSLIIFSAIILLFLGAGVVIKNILLNQIKKNIEASFYYDHLHMSFFPPLLVMEEVRTRTITPFFTAEKISMSLSYKSLLTRQRPFQVEIEHPVLKISESPAKDETGTKRQFELSFPVLVEQGLIKDGEFYFQGKEVSFQSKGVKAVFIQRKNEFSLEADAEENVFFPGSARPRLEGKINVFIESRGQKIHVKKLKIDSKDFWVESEGSLVNPLDPELNLKTSFRASVPLVIEFLHLPFEWKGDTEGEGILARTGEGISFEADFTSNNFHLNGVDMGEMSGKIHSDRSGRTVEFNYRRGSMPREYVKVHFAGKKVEGTLRGAFLDPVIKYFALNLPIASPAWGSFYLNEEKLEADIEFKDDYSRDKPGQYPFRGPLKLIWDLKKRVTISSPSLFSTFGEFDLEGILNVGQDLDITVQGGVTDLKQAREFTSILLSKNYAFPEIRGEGEADLHVFGDYYLPQVQAGFSFSPGGVGLFDVESVSGEAEIIEGDFFGRFNLEDPDMKGRIGLLSSQEGLKADIRLEQGLVERILRALNIDLSLEGNAQGNFEFRQKGEDIQVRGDFAGELLNFVGQDLREVSGKLEWRENTLSLSDLQFHLHQGVVKGSTTLGLLNQAFDIHIQGDDIDLSSLYSGVTGKLRFLLDGKGIFGKDFALGPFEIKDLYHSPFQKTEARGLARFSHSQGKLGLDLSGNFSPGDNDFNVSFLIPTLEDSLSVGIRGSFSNLDLLLPWAKGVRGRVNYLGEVKGPKASPQVKGAIDFNGSIFPWPGFAHAFRDYSGLMFVENNKLTFRSLRAELGGGDVQGSGELLIGDGGIEIIHAKLEGKNMLLSPLERTRALADGTLNLIKEPGRFVLGGDIYAHKLSWRREIEEQVVFYSKPYYEMEKKPGFFDDLTLNIRLRADDDAWMENSLGRIRGRFDLTVTGSVSEPVITGEMEGLGGDVNFQDRKFKLLVGRVNFINPTSTQPYLNFKGETHVKDYRVTFSLDGLLDHLNPEFTSSPPLPPEDVLALLALGDAFRRTYSYDTSTRLSTASLISFQLSEEAKKRAEGLFTIDRFRIDPFVMGSSAEMSARLTVGKKISRNFFILYSTNLTTQREEIARLEWELTDDISIVGIRDEEGRISFDVKIYKRF